MARTTLCALLAAPLIAVAASASAQTTIAGWEISSSEGLCMMEGSYTVRGRPGVQSSLAFALSEDHQTLVVAAARSDWNLADGRSYEVEVSVDRIWTGHGTAKVIDGTTFGVALPASRELLLAIARGGELRIRTPKGVLTYSLEGTDRAMPALARCALGAGSDEDGSVEARSDDDRSVEADPLSGGNRVADANPL